MNSITICTPIDKIKPTPFRHLAVVRQNIYNNIQFYKSRITMMLIVYVFIMFGLSVFTGFCAVGYTEGEDMVGVIQGWIKEIYGTTTIEEIRSLTYIVFNSETNTFAVGGITINTLSSLITNIHKVFKNLGYMLLIGYLLIGFMEDLSFNQMYLEKMIKKMIFFFLGMVLIMNAMDVVYSIVNIGAALVNKASGVATENMPNYDALCQKVYDECTTAKDAEGIKDKLFAKGEDLTRQLGYVIQLFLPWAAAKAASLMTRLVCWSRFIEILLLGIMSPLSFADMSKGSIEHSNTLKAIKNIVALSISGAMILIICIICNQIQGSLVQNADFGTSLWNSILIAFVQVGLVHRATDIVKQGLGMA